jgi:prevent-host-death family protein
MRKVKVIPISEARPKLTNLVAEVSESREPYFIASRSKVKAVLMGIDEYEALIEQIEDLEDNLDILKARLEGEPARPLEDFVRVRHRRDVYRGL